MQANLQYKGVASLCSAVHWCGSQAPTCDRAAAVWLQQLQQLSHIWHTQSRGSAHWSSSSAGTPRVVQWSWTGESGCPRTRPVGSGWWRLHSAVLAWHLPTLTMKQRKWYGWLCNFKIQAHAMQNVQQILSALYKASPCLYNRVTCEQAGLFLFQLEIRSNWLLSPWPSSISTFRDFFYISTESFHSCILQTKAADSFLPLRNLYHYWHLVAVVKCWKSEPKTQYFLMLKRTGSVGTTAVKIREQILLY